MRRGGWCLSGGGGGGGGGSWCWVCKDLLLARASGKRIRPNWRLCMDFAAIRAVFVSHARIIIFANEFASIIALHIHESRVRGSFHPFSSVVSIYESTAASIIFVQAFKRNCRCRCWCNFHGTAFIFMFGDECVRVWAFFGVEDKRVRYMINK